jgi:hypothetical protein
MTAPVRLALVPGLEKTTPDFKAALVGVARRVQCDPSHLAAVMAFETGKTFSPSIRNPNGGATGLIQFMPQTARNMGTTTEALAAMTATAQLRYVEKYLENAKGQIGTLEGLYLKIFTGHTSKLTGQDVIFSEGSIEYAANKVLDYDKNGAITVSELTSGARAMLSQAKGFVMVQEAEGATADPIGPLSSGPCSSGPYGEATPPAGEGPPPADPSVWIVSEGDTLSSIARALTGSADRWHELREANRQIKNPNRIYPGQRIKIPPSWHASDPVTRASGKPGQ